MFLRIREGVSWMDQLEYFARCLDMVQGSVKPKGGDSVEIDFERRRVVFRGEGEVELRFDTDAGFEIFLADGLTAFHQAVHDLKNGGAASTKEANSLPDQSAA